MGRSRLIAPAAAFIGAIAAEAHGGAGWTAGAALGALAVPRARISGCAALTALLVAVRFGHPTMLTEESRTARFAGTVVGDTRVGDADTTFAFALDGGSVVAAHVYGGSVMPGERLVLRGRLVPFDEARNPGEPSRRAIALAEGLAGELIANRIVARAPPDPRDARTWAARLRAALSARLRTALREPEATVVAGALWGERGTLPGELRDQFQATGTVHVLVTAGLHLGVIAALVLVTLRWCRLSRAPAALATIPCVIAYAWLSGAHLPSQRAATMVSVALLARACGARPVSWNAFAVAAIVVAALWPASVTSVSFALSFSCVGAILLFAEPLGHVLERWALPERVREALALTIATQVGVWPLSAATFGLVAPYAVLANAIVVPATAAGMLAGIATLCCAQLPVLGRAAATIATWDVDAIMRVVAAVASLPGAHVRVPPPPPVAIVAYDAVAVAAAFVLRRNGRLAGALLGFATLAVLVTTLRLPDGRLTVTVLDVGQGDGIVIRTPRGHTILIDSGGRLERGPPVDGKSPAELVGERIVLGYLLRQGVRSIDLLVLTHPHGDHVGGCSPIIEAMPVGMLFDSGQTYRGRAYRDCIASAHAHGVPIILARRGMRWSSRDGVMLDVLAPEMPFLADTGDDVNENSIVVMLRAGVFRELFMGDAGEASESRLLATDADLRADVVKVGHHGSRYASTPAFVAAVRPRLALISVGRHNTFGHPAPATVDAWHGVGADVLRTDQCGAILLVNRAPATTLRCAALDRAMPHR